MNARSLVFDLFGDYLRYRGGEVRLRTLIALMGCFDVPESTVRVVVTRLRKEGWLASKRSGRETVYTLTAATWALLDEGRSRIFDRAAGPWDGHWRMVIYSVSESERALREQLRKKLAWFGFGPLSSSVWLSPHNRLDAVRAAFADVTSAQLDMFCSRSEGVSSDKDIAARAWDLAGLNREYDDLLTRYRHDMPTYQDGMHTAAEALVERTRLVADYRRFPFRDPDLPPELLPDGWSGRQAHDAFLKAHGLLRPLAEACVDNFIDAVSVSTTDTRS